MRTKGEDGWNIVLLEHTYFLDDTLFYKKSRLVGPIKQVYIDSSDTDIKYVLFNKQCIVISKG